MSSPALSLLRSYCSPRTWRKAHRRADSIIYWSEGGGRIVAVVRGDCGDHLVYLSETSVDCSCWGFITHPYVLCSHIAAVLIRLAREGRARDAKRYIEVFENGRRCPPKMFLKTSLKNLNELFATESVKEGGLPVGVLTEFYGFPESGKTILVFQLAYEAMKSMGSNALLWDTEGGISKHMIPFWKPRFDRRYGINPKVVDVKVDVEPIVRPKKKKEEAEEEEIITEARERDLVGYSVKIRMEKAPKEEANRPRIYVLRCGAIEKILAIHGFPVIREISDAGKMTIRLLPHGHAAEYWDSPMYRLVKMGNIKYIAYDSVSAPLDIFGSAQENFPARSDAAKYWLTQAQNIAEDLDAIIIGTFHASINPAQPIKLHPVPKDGVAPLHRFKYIIYMEKGRGKDTRNLVKLYLRRHTAKEGWTDVNTKVLRLTNGGYVDV